MKQKRWIFVVYGRRFFVIAILLGQIGFLLFLITRFSRAFQYASYCLTLLSIGVCLYILNKNNKPAFRLTWIILILLFPIFGGVFYVFFHAQGASRKMRRSSETLDAEYQPYFLLPGDVLPTVEVKDEDCLPQVRYLQSHAGFPAYERTHARFFNSGETFYQALLPELEKAERYIFLEFFVLRQGLMLDPVIDLLEKKARDGLDVRIIFDDLGCLMSLPTNYQQHLEGRGIQCIVFNPFKPILSSLQNNRDHRKIVSIDGKVAFTGGINLADEYINEFDRFGHWKDSGIMLEGDAAWSLTLIFLHMWNLYRNTRDDLISFYPWKDAYSHIPTEGYIQPYADSPIDGENVGEQVYIQIINNAKRYVYISTPYLVVDDNLLSALTMAAKSGVDVRIIVPHRWDKWVVKVLSQSFYGLLVSAGVKIYEYTAGFNHSKTFVSDDKVATVGTTNLDYRSLYLHFECGVWLYKNPVVIQIKEDFLNTIPVSRLITEQDCYRNALQRLIENVFRIIAPIM